MSEFTEKHRKGARIAALIIFLLFVTAVTVFLGKPLLSLFEDPEYFRDWVAQRGWYARIVFVGMVALQVVVALIPGEPLEIAAGLAFGTMEGTILCLLGIALGSLAVFLLVRSFGIRFLEIFFPKKKISSLKFLQRSRKADLLIFLLMFIPGTPKDLLSYFVGLTKMNLGHCVILVTFARIPSVVTSTIGGNALGTQDYGFAIWVFAISGLISAAGIFLYERWIKRKEKKKKSDPDFF